MDNTGDSQRRRPGAARSLARDLSLPVAFLLVMVVFFPFRERFEFNTDEGINLMKGMLVLRGHRLYEEIWSDQPPLFTHMLAAAFRLFGMKVSVARLLVLSLSCILFWAVCRFLRMVWGNGHAIGGAVLLVLLPHYPGLSVATMVGLPALSFAMVSLTALAGWHHKRKGIWLVLSAIALSLSILTKIFTGFLVPAFAGGILVVEWLRLGRSARWRDLLGPAALWVCVLLGVTIGLGLVLVGPANLAQLVQTHLAAGGSQFYDQFAEEINIAFHLRDSWAIMFLALVGSVLAFLSKRWLALYPMAWAGGAYLLLSFHKPVWYHQQLLVTIPAAILAAAAIGETIRAIRQLYRSHRLLSARGALCAVVVVAAGLVMNARVPVTLSEFGVRTRSSPSIDDGPLEAQKLVAKMIEYAPRTDWVVTDVPMYAFRAGLSVPPYLVVSSQKRMVTGSLNEGQVLEIVREWRPEQVLLGRFHFPTVTEYLDEHYRLVSPDSGKRLYLRNDL